MKVLFVLLFAVTMGMCSGCTQTVDSLNNTKAVDTIRLEENQLKKDAAAVKQYLEFMELRKAKSPDMEKIASLYEKSLRPWFEKVDTLQKGFMDAMDAYYEQAASQKDKTSYLQGMEKSMQRGFVLLLEDQLVQLANNQTDRRKQDVMLDRARTVYGGISSTAIRRGEYVGNKELFDREIGMVFDYIEKMQKEGNGEKIQEGSRKIMDQIHRVYFLSVIYELEGIKASLQKDPALALEKQVEGKVFFSILKKRGGDKQSTEAIEKEMNRSIGDMQIPRILDHLKIAFPDYFNDYQAKINKL